MPDVDEAGMESLGHADHSRRAYSANLERSVRAIGRECCRLRQPGYLTTQQLDRLLLGLWSANTVASHKRELRELDVLVRVKRRYYLRNFHRCNATIDDMERRREADKARAAAKKRRQRSSKTPKGWGETRRKNAAKTNACADVPPVKDTGGPARRAAPALALQSLRCARVRYGGGARAPWSSRYDRLRKAPPPRPFTDTELDAFQDEFDRLDAEHARRETLAGDPPAAPGPQPLANDEPGSPSKAAPCSFPRSLFAAMAAGDIAAVQALGAAAADPGPSTPAPEAPGSERFVSGDGNGKIATSRGAYVRQGAPEPDLRPKAVKIVRPRGPAADLAFIQHMAREHRVLGFNAVAAVNLGVSCDVARQAFEIAKERRPRPAKPCRFIFKTMKKLHLGWAAAP